MKANSLLLTVLIFRTLSSSLAFTSPEYTQWQHPFPDEFLDLAGIPKNLMPRLIFFGNGFTNGFALLIQFSFTFTPLDRTPYLQGNASHQRGWEVKM